MASGWYRASVILPMDSGLPKDSAVNVWSFRNITEPVDPEADATSIVNTLSGFYTDILSLYSSRVNPNLVQFKIFNLQDDQPRVPVWDTVIDIGDSTTSNMDFPPEVALCLSFKGAAGSGLNARRRRGRVYLGPLQSSSTTDYHEALAANITTIMTAAATHLEDPDDNLEWCVYSPYTHHGVPVGRNINETTGDPPTPVFPEVTANLFDSFVPITHYWMDNAWDTQRRRGTDATTRTTVAI